MGQNAQPITYHATATDRGRVEYDVHKAGTFTLGFDHSHYAHGGDEQRLYVAYGRWDSENSLDRRTALPQAPTINRITPVGGSWFSTDKALEYLARDEEWRWSGWLTVGRAAGPYVPERTRDRLAQIVAVLARDFLARADYKELLHAHRVRLAPGRAAEHQERLQGVQEELAEWQSRVAHERRLLEIQEQLIAGGPWAESGPVPRWRDYQHAKTRGGQQFLIGTVGTRDPRWR